MSDKVGNSTPKIMKEDIDKVFEKMMETDPSIRVELHESVQESMRTMQTEVSNFCLKQEKHDNTPMPPKVTITPKSPEELNNMSEINREAYVQAVKDAKKYLKWKKTATELTRDIGQVAAVWLMHKTLELGIEAKAAAAAKGSGAAATSEPVVPSPAFTFGTGPASGSPSQASGAAPGNMRMGSPRTDTVGAGSASTSHVPDPATVGGKRKEREATPDDMADFRRLLAEAKKREGDMKARREQRKANSNA